MKQNKLISLVCPTRQRSALQKRLVESVCETAYRASMTEIVFGIDNNDTTALKTAEELKARHGEDFIKVVLVEPNAERFATLLKDAQPKLQQKL